VYDNELFLAKSFQFFCKANLKLLKTEIYGIIEEMSFTFLRDYDKHAQFFINDLLCIGYLFILSYENTLVIVVLIAMRLLVLSCRQKVKKLVF
jgi:putative ATP-binding cassette transporter